MEITINVDDEKYAATIAWLIENGISRSDTVETPTAQTIAEMVCETYLSGKRKSMIMQQALQELEEE
jgi:hypothetical protein